MSYDVDFCDPIDGNVINIDTPHMMHGGNYCIGGTTELSLNITYNYAPNYGKHNFSIRDLSGKTALEAIPELERVISELGDESSSNYWDAVDGNAKKALIQLLTMAKMRPDSKIKVY